MMLVRIGSALCVSTRSMLLAVVLVWFHVGGGLAATTQLSITTTTIQTTSPSTEPTTVPVKSKEQPLLHDELNTLLTELRHVAKAIDSVRKEHTRLSKGVSDINESVKEMSERSQHIQKKIHKISKSLNKSNHHHKFKEGLKALQKDHEHIIRAVTSLTLHHRSLTHHHTNKSKNHKIQVDNTTEPPTMNDTIPSDDYHTDEVVGDGTPAPPPTDLPEVEDIVASMEVQKKSQVFPRDCTEVIQMGNYTSGIYRIQPKGLKNPIKVWCDHTTQGGGWTIFVARKPQEKQQEFSLTWDDYKKGFGSPDMEHWIGNEALHLMTSGRRHEIRLNITDWKDEAAWAAWKDFNVASEAEDYTLTIGRYASGSTAGDAMKWHNQMKFSTPDKDNDALMGGHCARTNDGGWWYKGYRGCYQAHPTGQFQKNPAQPPKTNNKRNFDLGPVLAWQNWRGETYFPKTLYLMFRPAP